MTASATHERDDEADALLDAEALVIEAIGALSLASCATHAGRVAVAALRAVTELEATGPFRKGAR